MTDIEEWSVLEPRDRVEERIDHRGDLNKRRWAGHPFLDDPRSLSNGRKVMSHCALSVTLFSPVSIC